MRPAGNFCCICVLVLTLKACVAGEGPYRTDSSIPRTFGLGVIIDLSKVKSISRIRILGISSKSLSVFHLRGGVSDTDEIHDLSGRCVSNSDAGRQRNDRAEAAARALAAIREIITRSGWSALGAESFVPSHLSQIRIERPAPP